MQWLWIILLCFTTNLSHVAVHVESKFKGAEKVAYPITALSETDSHTYYIASEENWQAVDPNFHPETIIIGPAGEHNLKLSGDVIVTGCWFRACYANAVMMLVQNAEKPLRIHIPMKMVSHGANRTLFEYYHDNFKRDDEFLQYIQKTAIDQFQMANPKVELTNDTLIITYDRKV